MSKRSEKEYYLRQTKLEGFGQKAQDLLKSKRILIIGMGGLGCPVADSLASTGFGYLKLVDFDIVEEKNLHRQHLYNIDDVGKNKAKVAADRLKKRNPYITVEAIESLVDDESIKSLTKNIDLVIDASDNMDTRLLSADHCFQNNIPYISGALYAWEAYVYHFKHRSTEDSSFRDLYPDGAGFASVESCADIGVLPILCQSAAVKMTHKALFELLQANDDASTQYFEHYDLKSDRWASYQFKINPNNPLRRGKLEKTQINLEALQSRIKEVQMVDVREPEEFETFNMGGINIPLGKLNERKEELSKNQTIVFVCETGMRSNSALSWLKKEHEDQEALHLFMGLQQLKKKD